MRLTRFSFGPMYIYSPWNVFFSFKRIILQPKAVFVGKLLGQNLLSGLYFWEQRTDLKLLFTFLSHLDM